MLKWLTKMTSKVVKPYGSWSDALPASFVTGGTYKGYSALKTASVDNTLFTIKQRCSDGSRVLFRWSKDEPAFVEVPTAGSIRNGVNEYGATGFFALSSMNYAYTSGGTIYWQKDGKTETISVNNNQFGNLFIHYDYLFALAEDKEKGVQRIVQFSWSNPKECIVVAEGYDFYAAPRVSENGKKLIFVAWNFPSMPWDATSIHIIPLDDGKYVKSESASSVKILPTSPNAPTNYVAVQWKPLSDSAFYYISDEAEYWSLYEYDLNSAKSKLIASEERRDLGDATWIVGDDQFYAVNSKILAFRNSKGINVIKLNENASPKLLPLPESLSLLANLTVDEDSNVYVTASGPSEEETVFSVNADGGNPKVVERSSDSIILKEYGFASPKSIVYPVTDVNSGEKYDIEGFYYEPTNPHCSGPPGEKPPVIIMAHGGPTGGANVGIDKKKCFYQSRGFALFDINYRGSTGYGRRFRDALYLKWGEADVQDIIEGVRCLVEKGIADESRIFVTGSSAGGYSVLRLLYEAPQLFRAAGCSYGIADIVALAKETHRYESAYNDRLIAPQSDTATWNRRNMVDKLGAIRTPVILFHGDEDPVVPMSQSQLIYENLKKRGIPTDLTIFKGEGHGFKKSENIQTVLNATCEFFTKTLQSVNSNPNN